MKGLVGVGLTLEWVGVNWNELVWVRIGWNDLKWIGQVGVGWSHLGCDEWVEQDRMGKMGLKMVKGIKMDYNGFRWVGMV